MNPSTHVTIGVPVRNEEKTIAKTLRGLLEQQMDGTKKPDIIVCCNASTDKTAQIVKEIAQKNPRVRLLELQEPGKPGAMNAIAQHADAKSQFVVFCDGDVHLKPGAVQDLLDGFKDNEHLQAVGAVPQYREWPGQNWVQRMAIAVAKTDAQRSLSGHLFAIRRESWTDLPERVFGEDLWLSNHLGHDHYKTKPVDAWTLAPATLRDYVRQHIRWNASIRQIKQSGQFVRRSSQQNRETASDRLRRLRQLPWSEKLLLLPAFAIDLYSTWKARKALKNQEYSGGWRSPGRKTEIGIEPKSKK